MPPTPNSPSAMGLRGPWPLICFLTMKTEMCSPQPAATGPSEALGPGAGIRNGYKNKALLGSPQAHEYSRVCGHGVRAAKEAACQLTNASRHLKVGGWGC